MSNDKKVSVVITAENHTQDGQPIAKGGQVAVDEATAKWLTDNKIGVLADAPKKESK